MNQMAMLRNGGIAVQEAIGLLARTILSFVTLLLLARLLGKQQLSQLSFFEYITGITIGGLAASITTDTSGTAWLWWLGLCAWSGLTLLVQFLALKNRQFSNLLAGRPSLVISHGKILETNMRKDRYRYEELLCQLRQHGIFDLEDVEFAVLESTGQLSVMRREQARAESGNRPTHLPRVLVQEGEILPENLRWSGFDAAWLEESLRQKGITDIKKVKIAVLRPNGELWVDT